ncbi:hypothetical protein MPSEU_000056900 [Mayamaea pseudoterrestris]|nr:hypothetical protein MPSEU_000056900 [Mayamaea pseudoterrestris]
MIIASLTMKLLHTISIISLLLQKTWSFSAGSSPVAPSSYHYFAFGSNMNVATMESLRNLRPISAQAGVLADYELVFDIPGIPLVEPSAASVRKQTGSVVHGVIYELTDADFARVGRTEGVPLSYQWQQCLVVPYVGDNHRAGEETLKAATANAADSLLSCYTLVANPKSQRRTRRVDHIPPSPSYLRILQDAAAYWQMDRSYQIGLGKIRTADKLLICDGVSGKLLHAAKLVNPSTTR